MATLTITQAGPSSEVVVPAIELQNMGRDPIRTSEEGRKLGDTTGVSDIRDDIEVPIDAVEALQKWNEPRINMWRVFATYFSFFVFGMNDGAYGVSLLAQFV
jgi:hypothetical protein